MKVQPGSRNSSDLFRLLCASIQRMMQGSRNTVFLLLSGLLLWGLIIARDKGVVTPLLVKGQAYTAPFQSGERLRYEVNWKPLFMLPAFKAGEISFEIGESQYEGRPAYNISMDAVSAGRLIEVAKLEVRNRFESIIDGKSFQSYRILKKTRQSKRKRDMLTVFDYRKNSTWLRELDVSVDPPKELRNQRRPGIPGPLNDVISAFYAVRLRGLEPGREYTLNLSDNGRVREMRVLVEKEEEVETRIGDFDSVKLLAQGGIFSEGRSLRIWYSRDRLRVPVKFEADVKFGTVFGELIQLEAGSLGRGLIRVK